MLQHNCSENRDFINKLRNFDAGHLYSEEGQKGIGYKKKWSRLFNISYSDSRVHNWPQERTGAVSTFIKVTFRASNRNCTFPHQNICRRFKLLLKIKAYFFSLEHFSYGTEKSHLPRICRVQAPLDQPAPSPKHLQNTEYKRIHINIAKGQTHPRIWVLWLIQNF